MTTTQRKIAALKAKAVEHEHYAMMTTSARSASVAEARARHCRKEAARLERSRVH
mgnify:CR=1 FL=1